MLGTPGGQGGFNQNQQNFAFNDGRTQIQYQSHQMSWSSGSQQGTPTPLPSTPQVFPGTPTQHLLPAPDMHQQMHNQAMQHHASAVQSAQQMHNNLLQNALQQTPLALPAPQLPFQKQPQIKYAPSPGPIQYQQSPPALSAPHPSIPHQPDIPSMAPRQSQQPPQPAGPSHSHQLLQLPAPPGRSEQDRAEERQRHQDLVDRMDRQSVAHQNAAQGAIQSLHEKLRGIESTQAQDRHQREAKDREVAFLHQQIAQSNQQALEAEQRHSRELTQALASTPRPQTSAINLGPLQQAIEEIKAGSVSRTDFKNMMDERLARVATIEDLQSAATLVSQEIDRASTHKMRSTLREEFADIQQKIAERQAPQQQRMLEAPYLQPPPPWQRPLPVQTDFIVRDADTASRTSSSSKKGKAQPSQEYDNASQISPSSRHSKALPPPEYDNASQVSSSSGKSKALPLSEPTQAYGGGSAPLERAQPYYGAPPAPGLPQAYYSGPPPTNDTYSRMNDQSNTRSPVSKASKATKSRAPTRPSDESAIARIKRPQLLPATRPEDTATEYADDISQLSSSSRRSKVPEAASSRYSDNASRVSSSSRKSRAMLLAEDAATQYADNESRVSSSSRRSKAPKDAATHYSDNASRVSSSSRRSKAMPPSENTASQASGLLTADTLSQLTAATPPKAHSSSHYAKSQASVQASPTIALARVKHSDSKSCRSSSKSAFADTPTLLPSDSESGFSISSASVRPIEIVTSLAHLGLNGDSSFPSSEQAVAAALAKQSRQQFQPFGESSGGGGYGEKPPDDLPDNASQVSSHYRATEQKVGSGARPGGGSVVSRQFGSGGVMRDNGTASTIRPKNDRRSDDDRRTSGLRQVSYPE